MNSNNPIRIQKLSFGYGEKQVLNNIHLGIQKRNFYSIIGPNGSGKTTLLKHMSRSLMPPKGTVYVDQTDLTRLKNKEIAKTISCVQQNFHIDFDFSVMDIVLMGRSPYLKRFQQESMEDVEIARKAMMATNLWHLKDKNINQISGGERQRAMIARALTQEASIMLLDEPISQLDIHHQIEILDNIKALTRDKEMTVVSVLHDLNMASEYSDFLILLNEGRIVSAGTPEQVMNTENIEEVYQLKVHIMKNPVTGKPYVIPINKNHLKG